ncbi:UNVERIFIED_CONTAM: F-box protein SKIP23 [Sesamum radiatum]|uniref:F-box protein SKIP23 n=2 Tax=Sesamum TaxID=4181 RepID=A0AAW2JXI3_SESRA
MDGEIRMWSDLPQELVEKIANCLDTETDVLRFRAICSSWRSLTRPFRRSLCTPLKLPLIWKSYHPLYKDAYYSLIERNVYRVQLPETTEPRFWLVMTERSSDDKLRILNPVCGRRIKILPETQLPKLLNTLDFRISEVCKGYTLRYMNPTGSKENPKYYFKQVIVSGDANNDEYGIMAIDFHNKLWCIKAGDDTWTLASYKWSNYLNYLDGVNHKGHIYVVDEFRGTLVFDSMFKSTEITRRPVHHHVAQSNLVELYKGELFLVDCYTRGVPLGNGCMRIKISRFDKQSEKWVGTKTIDNHIIFLGHDCSFSVPAEEFDGSKGTRVFYESEFVYFLTDDAGYRKRDVEEINFVVSDEVKLKFKELHGHNTGVCDFATGKTGSLLMHPEYAAIFWPPPSWLTRI